MNDDITLYEATKNDKLNALNRLLNNLEDEARKVDDKIWYAKKRGADDCHGVTNGYRYVQQLEDDHESLLDKIDTVKREINKVMKESANDITLYEAMKYINEYLTEAESESTENNSDIKVGYRFDTDKKTSDNISETLFKKFGTNNIGFYRLSEADRISKKAIMTFAGRPDARTKCLITADVKNSGAIEFILRRNGINFKKYTKSEDEIKSDWNKEVMQKYSKNDKLSEVKFDD